MSEEQVVDQQEAPETSALALSDEEFMNMPWEEPVEEVQETVTEQDTVEDDASEAADEVEADDEPEVDEVVEDEEQPEADQEDEAGESESASDKETDQAQIDFEAEYKRLLAPFKANGKEVQVESVEDAIQLMQMGAGFNKKMAALKPNLKLLKMLDNNGLLQEDKLSFLIDLEKKDPNAIKKFIQESKIDPDELTTDDGDVDYKPNTYTVSDSELALDEVLENIKSTPSYQKTVDVVSNKWDQSSRETIVKNPQAIQLINDHMENGIYDQIMPVVERERMLGRLSGLSDIEAYRQVGDQLHAQGKFGNPEPTPEQSTEPKPKPQANPKVTKRKRAAAQPSSKAASNQLPSDFNLLALSDAEFEKMMLAKPL